MKIIENSLTNIKNYLSYYIVHKTDAHLHIDGNWNKQIWKRTKSLLINNENDWGSSHKPQTDAKLCYDNENIYVIFRVKDQYLKCATSRHNGPVWQDSCVEFFFSPYSIAIQKYFNIEVNCNGYAYMAFQRDSKIDYDLFPIEDIEATKIVHTLNSLAVKEIEQPIEWFIEYKLPFAMLAKYSAFLKPQKGTIWRANFYKCAENNSHPHWLSWTKIKSPKPDFHLIQFMGTLKFN